MIPKELIIDVMEMDVISRVYSRYALAATSIAPSTRPRTMSAGDWVALSSPGQVRSQVGRISKVDGTRVSVAPIDGTNNKWRQLSDVQPLFGSSDAPPKDQLAVADWVRLDGNVVGQVCRFDPNSPNRVNLRLTDGKFVWRATSELAPPRSDAVTTALLGQPPGSPASPIASISRSSSVGFATPPNPTRTPTRGVVMEERERPARLPSSLTHDSVGAAAEATPPKQEVQENARREGRATAEQLETIVGRLEARLGIESPPRTPGGTAAPRAPRQIEALEEVVSRLEAAAEQKVQAEGKEAAGSAPGDAIERATDRGQAEEAKKSCCCVQ
jgi:hypothetical protein